MSIRRKPEDAVLLLLNYLDEAMELAVGPINESNKEDPLVLKFKNIEHELQSMKDFLSKVKHWEGAFIKKFTALEQEIADDIFKDRDKVDKINEKLQLIADNIVSIKELISLLELQVTEKVRPRSPQRQSQSEEWSQLSVEERVFTSPAMPNLQASFDNLETFQLKLCLLCFSIFPDNCVIKKRPLIYWWIGEGLVTKTNDKAAEEVGEDIFKELIKEGLINPFYENSSPFADSCTVHPWVRRMLILVAKKAEFFNFDSAGRPCNDSRRAFLMLGNEDSIGINNGFKEETLLTIFNVNEKYLSFKPDRLSKLKRVVVLQLGRWQNSPEHHIEVEEDESLDGLGDQKYLRYLSLQGISRITTLPPSITKLISLEILDLRACHNLEKLPSDISLLRNLTHLDVSECYLLESMPKGLEKLSALRVLKGFVIGNLSNTPCKLSNLAQLENLRKLSIFIGSEAVVQEGEFMNFKDITDLRILTISWGVVNLTPNLEAAMEKFSFPPNLLKLDLRCVPQETTPKWLNPSELENLEKLYIRGGKLNSLGNEDNKWKVKYLRLKYLKNLKVEPELLAKFPDVVYLEIKCHEIEKDKYDDDFVWNKPEEEEGIMANL